MKKKPVVFIVCTGLGHINRGYESFTRECFDVLKNNSEFELYLIKGGGKIEQKEIVVPSLFRTSRVSKIISKLFKLNTYFIEQASFSIAFAPYIFKKKPALIYYSDFVLGTYLWHLRKLLKFKYKLLYVNGAPNGPPYKTEDCVQQLLPVYYSIGIKSETLSTKNILVPYAFNINIKERLKAISEKEKTKKALGFLADQKIILSVGAINKTHKRIDYLINEVAKLRSEYFLIILGQEDEETPELITLADQKLPNRYIMKNLSHSEVYAYYSIADYFVLASVHEGFPRVTIEALSFGLPCIVHDYVVMRQVLENNGVFIDMRFDNELSKYISNNTGNKISQNEIINEAYRLYSWDMLKDKYTDMIIQQISQN